MCDNLVLMDKYQPHRNEELHRAMMEKRRSSAASPHADRRTKRAKTRANQLRKSIEEG